jgi:glycosyltransferase involved in cell wall biosynthesis
VKASIVIRTYNSERTIGRVLEAVCAQSFTDYEVVVVDSGSTDATLHILQSYSHTLMDYSKESFTYSGSLNAGCAAARGEYVVCLSSHCIPLEGEWLGSLVDTMEDKESLAGAWGPLYFDARDQPVRSKGVEVMGLEEFYRRPNQGLQNPNAIIRKKLWEEHPFSEKVERCEDQEWAHHFLKRGYRTAKVGKAGALYEIPHTPYRYGGKIMKDLLVLNQLFGYRPVISAAQILRRSTRLIVAAVTGGQSYRKATLAISSMLGRWFAYKIVVYRELLDQVDREAEGGTTLKGKVVAARVKAKLRDKALRARRALLARGRGGPPGLKRKTRFFLVGEMRSGTSWLSRTLNAHPEIYCKGEGSFFGRDQAVEEIPVYKGPTPSLYNALASCEGFRTWYSFPWNAWGKGDVDEDLMNLTRMTVDYFLTKDPAADGKRIIGDKSPLHTDHVDEIHRFYPEAKIIHIYRDGRDVAVSLMHHFWRLAKDRGGIFELEPEEIAKRDAYYADPGGFLASGDSIFTEERLKQMAVRWDRRVSKASRDGSSLFGPNFVQLRYEDLLDRSQSNLKVLFELLGARADEAVIRGCVEQNSFEKLAKRSRGQSDAESFFRKGVAGDWRNVFNERDRKIYREIAGDTLLKIGYTLD